MSEYVGLHDNGKSSVQGFMDIFSGLYGSGVANISNTTAWAVSQRGAGANMSVDIAPGRGLLPDTLIHYPAWSDAAVNKTITTADPSNPRRDIVVAYIDESVPSTTVTNNLGALKFAVVAGTAAASPSDPSDPTIQSAVGTGNPWIKLARVTVNAGATSIVDGNITDLRTTIAVKGKVNTEAIADQGVTTPKIADDAVTTDKIAPAAVGDTELKARFSEVLSDFIYSGGVVAQSAGLVGTFSNIVYYIGGVRYTATSVPNKTYTASKDTYVDINSSGTPTYTEVANNAASPALTAGYIRVAKVVTNGSAITSVLQNGTDSLGNKIYNLAMDIKRSLPVLSRQGGNASSWSVGGTSNYDTRGLGAFIQTGAIAVTANPTTVTFPVPFSQPPIVVATTASAGSAQTYMIVTGQAAASFMLRAVNENGTAVFTEYADWMAIGI